ncbi:hypothetical protein DZF93_17065, partial [Clavibacter michiganensis subsp. insidiosus]
MEQGRRRLHGRLGRPLADAPPAPPDARSPRAAGRPRVPRASRHAAGVRIRARTIGGCPGPPTTTPSAGPARTRIPRSPARPSRSGPCHA